MNELSKHGHGCRQLHVYLQAWKWPKAYAGGRDVFKGSVQERSRPKDTPPAGAASETLSVGPVVRKWQEYVIKPQKICPAQVASLLLCIAVMDLLLQANTGRVTPNMVTYAMARHYAAHVVAYGYKLFVPKHHFMLHLPRQLARFSFLIACFVHERKHKVAKRWVVHCQAAELRSNSARRVHDGTRKRVGRSIAETVLAGSRASISASGGCTAGMWLRNG